MVSTGPPPVYMEPQQPQTVIQQPAVMVQPDPSVSNTVRSHGNWKGLRITGYLQVAIGLSSVLLGIIAIVYKSFLFYVGIPVWAGICFYTVTGILGIAAGGKQKNSLVTGYLIMSVISTVVAFAMVFVASVGVPNDKYTCPDLYRYHHDYDFTDRHGCSSSAESRIAIDALIVVMGVAEFVIAIIGASLTCSSLCCGGAGSHPMVYYHNAPQVVVGGQPQGVVQYAVGPQQQYVQQPQLGNVVYPGQVVLAPAQPQFQPQFQPQGQAQYQPTLQGQAQLPMQAQAQAQAPAPLDEKPPSAPKGFDLPEDHHNKPLIT